MAFHCRQFLVFESREWKGLLVSQSIESQHLLQYRSLEFDAQMGICLCLQGKIYGFKKELKITSRCRKMIFDGDLMVVLKCPLWSWQFRRVYVSLQNLNLKPNPKMVDWRGGASHMNSFSRKRQTSSQKKNQNEPLFLPSCGNVATDLSSYNKNTLNTNYVCWPLHPAFFISIAITYVFQE